MNYPEERILFTIKDIVYACGISRATLLRMEEDGYLKPYHTDPQTGYRYYDANNITQIGQYQMMRELGLSRREIADYYYRRGDIKEFIEKQQLRLNRLQRLLNELDIRYDHSRDYSFSFIKLPEITCYCLPLNLADYAEAEKLAYDSYQKMIKEGFKVLGSEPFFLIMPDNAAAPSGNGLPAVPEVCFPVIPPEQPDERIKTFPACTAFSMIAHGGYDILSNISKRFHEEVARRKLTPIGPDRIIALVAPYVGEHYSADDYCCEYTIPVDPADI